MSLNLPSRRALAAASSGLRCAATPPMTTTQTLVRALPLRPRQPAARPLHTTSARPARGGWGGLFGWRKKKKAAGTDVASGLSGDLDKAETRQALKEHMTNPQLGASPFLSEMEAAATTTEPATPDGRPGHKDTARHPLGTSLVPEHLQRALDPDPRSRVRWERKMVMQHVGRLLDPAGAETRAERLARTERVLLHKSTPLATSTKKLVHLAHQIAGKTLEEALVQMQFSRKKMAKEVAWHLEEARDMAIVERGMGLEKPAVEAAEARSPSSSDGIKIQTKDGRWLTITDPSRIYIDEAWVTKGEWRGARPDYRARGRRFMKWSPSAFLSVVLKEEKTRIRQHDERVAKQAKKAPWVHLPNRPVTAQRPYYSW